MEWPPKAEDIPELPLEILAISLLKFVSTQGHNPVSRMHLFGTNGRVWSMGGRYSQPEVLSALNEAWDWLFSNGLMVNAGPQWEMPAGQTIEGHRLISRKGRHLLESPDPLSIIRSERLLTAPLHSRIEAKARIQFAIGAYGSAVHEAFKELEVRVREMCLYPPTTYGDTLMRKAFNPDKGRITDKNLVPSEQRAVMELFTGGIGAFKNPLSHRTVDYDDPIIAAEQLLFADLLHRMLDVYDEETRIFDLDE